MLAEKRVIKSPAIDYINVFESFSGLDFVKCNRGISEGDYFVIGIPAYVSRHKVSIAKPPIFVQSFYAKRRIYVRDFPSNPRYEDDIMLVDASLCKDEGEKGVKLVMNNLEWREPEKVWNLFRSMLCVQDVPKPKRKIFRCVESTKYFVEKIGYSVLASVLRENPSKSIICAWECGYPEIVPTASLIDAVEGEL